MTSYLDTLRQIRVEIPGRPKAVFDDFARDVWEQLVAVAEAAELINDDPNPRCTPAELAVLKALDALRAAVEAQEKP